MTTSTPNATSASGEPRSCSDPPRAVYAKARGATPIAVARAKVRSGMCVIPAA